MALYNIYESLPRPENWMPGPPAPWSKVDPNNRKVTKSRLTDFLNKRKDIEDTSTLKQNFDTSFSDLPDVALERLGDNDEMSKPSAVLVPFIVNVQSQDIESVVVMTRTMTVSLHKGQVSFPGGMVEEQDSTYESTALRETYEEIGISSEQFSIIGRSSQVSTRSKYAHIVPIVATCDKQAMEHVNLNHAEVDVLHNVLIEELLKPDNYFCEIWDFGTLAVPINMYFVVDTEGREVFIWGATAHILTELLHCSSEDNLK